MNEWYEFVTLNEFVNYEICDLWNWDVDLELENLCLNLYLSNFWLYNITQHINLVWS